MVVLDQHPIIEPEAVTLSAAQPDRPFLKCAQARGGFSRIKKSDRCTFYGFAKLCCQCGDSGQALHEIQCHPLAFQDAAAVPCDREYCATGRDAIAV